VALVSVGVLAGTGVYQAWRGVGSWHALTSTAYGRLLLVKVGLVVLMLGAARFSRRWTGRLREAPATGAAEAASEALEVAAAEATAEAAAEPDQELDPERRAQLARQQAVLTAARVRRTQDGSPAQAGLRRSVLIEAAVAVGVLAVTTMLTNSPPGRVAAATPAAAAAPAPGGQAQDRTVRLQLPYDTGGKEAGAKGTATLTVTPATTGGNQLTLVVAGGDGKPVDVPETQVSFTLPDRDLGPLPVKLAHTGTGTWTGTAQLPLAGDWVAAVVVRSSDIDQDTETKQLTIN
jgi:copper transport protein